VVELGNILTCLRASENEISLPVWEATHVEITIAKNYTVINELFVRQEDEKKRICHISSAKSLLFCQSASQREREVYKTLLCTSNYIMFFDDNIKEEEYLNIYKTLFSIRPSMQQCSVSKLPKTC
jgi:hypothetical protein